LSNERVGRFPAAHEARVLITQVENPGPDGRPQVAFTGMLPLIWSHQEMWPAARTVGPPAIADLFYVSADRSLVITSVLTPFNFPNQGSFTQTARLWVTLQAQSTEGDSKPIRIEISWDGQWDRGEAEMAQHLQLSVQS
jgi:hypothetical protein